MSDRMKIILLITTVLVVILNVAPTSDLGNAVAYLIGGFIIVGLAFVIIGAIIRSLLRD
jgi:hypothetical protein